MFLIHSICTSSSGLHLFAAARFFFGRPSPSSSSSLELALFAFTFTPPFFGSGAGRGSLLSISAPFALLAMPFLAGSVSDSSLSDSNGLSSTFFRNFSFGLTFDVVGNSAACTSDFTGTTAWGPDKFAKKASFNA